MEGMTMCSDAGSSIVSLDIGGKKFRTTVDTLTQREPHSMLAAMFSGRHAIRKDPKTGYVFIDRDGKRFQHILNWLRDGVALIPSMSDLERLELLQEAEYYQLLGLVDKINEVLNRKEDVERNKGCAVCGSLPSKRCSGCKAVRYCSKSCQRSHWKSGHKEKCEDFRLSRNSSFSRKKERLNCPSRLSLQMAAIEEVVAPHLRVLIKGRVCFV